MSLKITTKNILKIRRVQVMQKMQSKTLREGQKPTEYQSEEKMLFQGKELKLSEKESQIDTLNMEE